MSSAAVLGQTDLNFSWILLIDPNLGRAYRNRLRDLCGQRVRVIIHEYDPSEPLDSSRWLDRYMEARPDFLITTHLDDDDAFSRTYVEELRRAANAFIQSEATPLIRTFGCKKMWQWNMIPARNAPLGIRSEWSGSAKVSSCGFSLMCKYPDVPLAILAMRHKRAENYLDFSTEPEDQRVADFRERLADILSSKGIHLHEYTACLGLEDLSDRTGRVVVGNHNRNVQAHRIRREAVRPVKVKGPQTFPDHTLNWEAARRYLPELRLPFRAMFGIRLRQLRTLVGGMSR
jgi:hypothetical protein